MAHFAQVDNNIVTRVIVINNEDLQGYTEPLTIAEASTIPILKELGGEWVQTSYHNNFRGVYAGIGYFWNGSEFIPPLEDTTPPTMSGLKVEIPSYWEVFFPDDTFILNGFIVELERINGALAVDIAYLQWANFQAELDKPINEAVKRHMMPIWDYVIEQINQNNFIQ